MVEAARHAFHPAPPFPLPRLRVRERMTEIRDRDLRFTSEEMTAFLNSLHRLNLPAEQIAALESRTEGWAAGVQLAALSLQGCSAGRATQFIIAFSGSHHYAEKLIESGAMWGAADALACGHLYVATALQAQGDIPGANQALAEASQVMRQHPLELASMP